MSDKPLLLDLYCGAGGATKGYQRAGFTVHGVDIKPQKHYCGDKFIQSDALAYVAQYGWMYDAIHASPPCQRHTTLAALHQRTDYQERHIDLIPQTRFWLKTIDVPYIIENVAARVLLNPAMLCGTQFGLNVFRHRFFESNVYWLQPYHTTHEALGLKSTGCTGKGTRINGIGDKGIITVCGHFGGVGFAQKAMGIDWMGQTDLAQAIPPIYTEYLGKQLMAYVLARKGQETKSVPELPPWHRWLTPRSLVL